MTVFSVPKAAGYSVKYHLFVYGSFVWEIHVRYNKWIYFVDENSMDPYQLASSPCILYSEKQLRDI